jgi:hypothetical protein
MAILHSISGSSNSTATTITITYGSKSIGNNGLTYTINDSGTSIPLTFNNYGMLLPFKCSNLQLTNTIVLNGSTNTLSITGYVYPDGPTDGNTVLTVPFGAPYSVSITGPGFVTPIKVSGILYPLSVSEYVSLIVTTISYNKTVHAVDTQVNNTVDGNLLSQLVTAFGYVNLIINNIGDIYAVNNSSETTEVHSALSVNSYKSSSTVAYLTFPYAAITSTQSSLTCIGSFNGGQSYSFTLDNYSIYCDQYTKTTGYYEVRLEATGLGVSITLGGSLYTFNGKNALIVYRYNIGVSWVPIAIGTLLTTLTGLFSTANASLKAIPDVINNSLVDEVSFQLNNSVYIDQHAAYVSITLPHGMIVQTDILTYNTYLTGGSIVDFTIDNYAFQTHLTATPGTFYSIVLTGPAFGLYPITLSGYLYTLTNSSWPVSLNSSLIVTSITCNNISYALNGDLISQLWNILVQNSGIIDLLTTENVSTAEITEIINYLATKSIEISNSSNSTTLTLKYGTISLDNSITPNAITLNNDVFISGTSISVTIDNYGITPLPYFNNLIHLQNQILLGGSTKCTITGRIYTTGITTGRAMLTLPSGADYSVVLTGPVFGNPIILSGIVYSLGTVHGYVSLIVTSILCNGVTYAIDGDLVSQLETVISANGIPLPFNKTASILAETTEVHSALSVSSYGNAYIVHLKFPFAFITIRPSGITCTGNYIGGSTYSFAIDNYALYCEQLTFTQTGYYEVTLTAAGLGVTITLGGELYDFINGNFSTKRSLIVYKYDIGNGWVSIIVGSLLSTLNGLFNNAITSVKNITPVINNLLEVNEVTIYNFSTAVNHSTYTTITLHGTYTQSDILTYTSTLYGGFPISFNIDNCTVQTLLTDATLTNNSYSIVLTGPAFGLYPITLNGYLYTLTHSSWTASTHSLIVTSIVCNNINYAINKNLLSQLKYIISANSTLFAFNNLVVSTASTAEYTEIDQVVNGSITIGTEQYYKTFTLLHGSATITNCLTYTANVFNGGKSIPLRIDNYGLKLPLPYSTLHTLNNTIVLDGSTNTLSVTGYIYPDGTTDGNTILTVPLGADYSVALTGPAFGTNPIILNGILYPLGTVPGYVSLIVTKISCNIVTYVDENLIDQLQNVILANSGHLSFSSVSNLALEQTEVHSALSVNSYKSNPTVAYLTFPYATITPNLYRLTCNGGYKGGNSYSFTLDNYSIYCDQYTKTTGYYEVRLEATGLGVSITLGGSLYKFTTGTKTVLIVYQYDIGNGWVSFQIGTLLSTLTNLFNANASVNIPVVINNPLEVIEVDDIVYGYGVVDNYTSYTSIILDHGECIQSDVLTYVSNFSGAPFTINLDNYAVQTSLTDVNLNDTSYSIVLTGPAFGFYPITLNGYLYTLNGSWTSSTHSLIVTTITCNGRTYNLNGNLLGQLESVIYANNGPIDQLQANGYVNASDIEITEVIQVLRTHSFNVDTRTLTLNYGSETIIDNVLTYTNDVFISGKSISLTFDNYCMILPYHIGSLPNGNVLSGITNTLSLSGYLNETDGIRIVVPFGAYYSVELIGIADDPIILKGILYPNDSVALIVTHVNDIPCTNGNFLSILGSAISTTQLQNISSYDTTGVYAALSVNSYKSNSIVAYLNFPYATITYNPVAPLTVDLTCTGSHSGGHSYSFTLDNYVIWCDQYVPTTGHYEVTLNATGLGVSITLLGSLYKFKTGTFINKSALVVYHYNIGYGPVPIQIGTLLSTLNGLFVNANASVKSITAVTDDVLAVNELLDELQISLNVVSYPNYTSITLTSGTYIQSDVLTYTANFSGGASTRIIVDNYTVQTTLTTITPGTSYSIILTGPAFGQYPITLNGYLYTLTTSSTHSLIVTTITCNGKTYNLNGNLLSQLASVCSTNHSPIVTLTTMTDVVSSNAAEIFNRLSNHAFIGNSTVLTLKYGTETIIDNVLTYTNDVFISGKSIPLTFDNYGMILPYFTSSNSKTLLLDGSTNTISLSGYLNDTDGIRLIVPFGADYSVELTGKAFGTNPIILSGILYNFDNSSVLLIVTRISCNGITYIDGDLISQLKTVILANNGPSLSLSVTTLAAETTAVHLALSVNSYKSNSHIAYLNVPCATITGNLTCTGGFSGGQYCSFILDNYAIWCEQFPFEQTGYYEITLSAIGLGIGPITLGGELYNFTTGNFNTKRALIVYQYKIGTSWVPISIGDLLPTLNGLFVNANASVKSITAVTDDPLEVTEVVVVMSRSASCLVYPTFVSITLPTSICTSTTNTLSTYTANFIGGGSTRIIVDNYSVQTDLIHSATGIICSSYSIILIGVAFGRYPIALMGILYPLDTSSFPNCKSLIVTRILCNSSTTQVDENLLSQLSYVIKNNN